MKFQFEKFGYVDKGTVELGDLTIICGPNNVGKTYVSYAIYNFLKEFKVLVNLLFSFISMEDIVALKEEGFLVLNLENFGNATALVKSVSKEFSQNLSDYFSSSSDFFEKSSIEFIWDDFKLELSRDFKRTVNFGEEVVLFFDRQPNSNELSIAIQMTKNNKIPNHMIQRVINNNISECLYLEILPKPFVVTSERTGIALFYKELDINRNAILEYMTKNEKLNPFEIFQTMTARYAHSIQDNIATIRDAEEISKRKSFIKQEKDVDKSVLGILQNLLGGSFKFVNNQLFYLPKKERNRSQVLVPFYLASSAVKSMFLLDLYINCLAEKDGLLIIDEPELNLHPDNQRKMASLLARLVNAGVKVLITTHSDYIIRELNNRIMLSNDVENKEEIMKKNAILTEDILLPEQVKAFVVKSNHSIQEIAVDKYGINFQIFDELIADSNKISDDIYYNIKD